MNIGQLVTLRPAKPGPRRGAGLGELRIIHDGAVLCLAGKIVSVGKTKDALRDSWFKKNRKKIIEFDCAGKVVLPGFVDSHTHPVFVAPRLVDFEKRIAGATYEQVAEAGGGIRSSIDGVRRASKNVLAERVLEALREMASLGTTTVEAKSGYGLSVEAELKSLQAIREAAKQWPGTVVPTLLGAHVVPKEFAGRADEYVRVICDDMIPLAAKKKLAQFVDVFCERGAFSEIQCSKIFASALQHGLEIRAHLGQLTAPSEGFIDSLVNCVQPTSLDHMDHVRDDEIRELAKQETIATLVPGANYFLGLEKYPPARKLIDGGVAVALATDYNPGSSPTASMPFVMSLACTHMKMSPAEAIAAATINGAWALRLQDGKGSIEPGKDADLAVFDVKDYREIAYWFASNRCTMTVLNGAAHLAPTT